MNRFWNIGLQLLLSAGQIWNLLEPVYPQHKVLAVALIGIVQLVISIVAHDYNPDGTPATQAYRGVKFTPGRIDFK